MKILSLVVSIVCGFAIAFAASENDVRQSLEVRGIPQPETIQLPQFASPPCRSVMQSKLENAAGRNLWIRLRCSGERRAFYALLTYGSSESLELAKTLFRRSAVGKESRTPILIRAGQVVHLVVRSGGMVLRQPVTSLQAGRMGQRIRVRDEAKRIHVASVRGETIVEAEL